MYTMHIYYDCQQGQQEEVINSPENYELPEMLFFESDPSMRHYNYPIHFLH